jgi:glutamine synthetase
MSYNLKTPEDVLRTITDDKIQMIDLRFTDLSGRWQHFPVPPSAFDLESFLSGVGFDRFPIRWSQEIQENNMLAIPDPASAFLDPFAEMPTLVLICNIRDPVIGQSNTRDPRYIAQKAEAYLRKTQIGDNANFGLTLKHFEFDRVGNDELTNYEGYAVDVRTQIVTTLQEIGIEVEAHNHEIATGGQGAIDMCFATLTRMADNLMIYRYVIKNIARRCGMKSRFVPNLPFGNNDSGLHVHQSIWLGARPLFAGDGYGGSSAVMRHYFAGLREHAPVLLAICAPAANSHRGPVAGFEARVNLSYYSQPNRSAACRIPLSLNPKTKRVEFQCPDPSCNPYLAFAAMLMAGIDGFDNRLYILAPDEPTENLYDMPLEIDIASASGSTEPDHAFLSKGDVFTPDVIQTLP